MNILITTILTVLFFGVAYADQPAPKKDPPKVVIAPVPGTKPDPKGLDLKDLKKHVIICVKTKGDEKLCIPIHKTGCYCPKE